jgi:CheY-like chemotaxis protein
MAFYWLIAGNRRIFGSHANIMSSQPTVLVADDDANDVFFLRRAFQKAGLACPIVDVSDGEKAISYLAGSDTYADRNLYPAPTLLFLDLKMPKVSGFEVLEWLQKHNGMAEMKVVVLSSSNLPSDMQKARSLGADDYRVKPADIDDMITMVKDIADRWLKIQMNG